MEHPYLAGGLMWSAIEYRGETCGFPVVTSQFGVLDICRFPKDTYYYYQMLWGKKPMIHIFPPWNRDVPAGTPVELYCCSNCDTITLELNGKVIKSDLLLEKNKTAVWEIPYEAGTLTAIGKKEGKTVCRAKLVTPGQPAALKITADNDMLRPGRKDLSFLRVDVVDENGNFVPDAAVDLEIKVSGAGTLAGVCSGDPASHERENTPFIRTFSGSALAIIQSTSGSGEIRVSVKGAGVKTAEMSLWSLIPPGGSQR
jgi:beta-galactosidase